MTSWMLVTASQATSRRVRALAAGLMVVAAGMRSSMREPQLPQTRISSAGSR